MNKEMKQHLENVVVSIVNEDTQAAKEAFHEYLRMKTQEVLGEKEEKEDEKSNPFAKKEEGEDEGSGEDKKSDKKSDKKEAKND